MTITTKKEGNSAVLTVNGRVDTNTSPQLQSEILRAFQAATNVVLDFEGVPYISSAGLRALLIGQKTAKSKRGTMELIHVSDMVMAVLDSVGFSSILTVK